MNIPSRDSGGLSLGGVRAGRRQSNVFDAVALLNGLGQVPQGNVVVVAAGAVIGVVEDLGNADGGASAGRALDIKLATETAKKKKKSRWYNRKLTRDPARIEYVPPTSQWAAVTTVLALSREPPQRWLPLRWRLTMKGNSPSLAGEPPMMLVVKSAGTKLVAFLTEAGAAAAMGTATAAARIDLVTIVAVGFGGDVRDGGV